MPYSTAAGFTFYSSHACLYSFLKPTLTYTGIFKNVPTDTVLRPQRGTDVMLVMDFNKYGSDDRFDYRVRHLPLNLIQGCVLFACVSVFSFLLRKMYQNGRVCTSEAANLECDYESGLTNYFVLRANLENKTNINIIMAIG